MESWTSSQNLILQGSEELGIVYLNVVDDAEAADLGTRL